MRIYYHNGNLAAGSDEYGGKAWYINGNTAAHWDNTGGKVWYINGNTAAHWDNSGGRAWYENGNVAAGWDKTGGEALDENGNIKALGTEIYLGDFIKFYAGVGGVSIYVDGNLINGLRASRGEYTITRKNNYQEVSIIKKMLACDWCSDKYEEGNGVYWHLRDKNNRIHLKYNFCSKQCASEHLDSGNYVVVDEGGLTKTERLEYNRREAEKIRKAKERIQKLEALKTNENKEFFRKYGVFLVFGICSFTAYAMLKDASSDEVFVKAGILILFFGFYVFYAFFPSIFDSKEEREKAKKYGIEPKPLPSFIRISNIILPIVFSVTVIAVAAYIKSNSTLIDEDFEYEMGIDEDVIQEEQSIETNTKKNTTESVKEEVGNSVDEIAEEYKVNDFFDGYAILKAQPSSSSENLSKINHGEKVAVLQKGNTWWKVRLSNGSEGYIHNSRLIPKDEKSISPWDEMDISKEDYMLLLEGGYIEPPFQGEEEIQ